MSGINKPDTMIAEINDEPAAKKSKFDDKLKQLELESEIINKKELEFFNSKLNKPNINTVNVKTFTFKELYDELLTVFDIESMDEILKIPELYENNQLTTNFYEAVAAVIYNMCIVHLNCAENEQDYYFLEKLLYILKVHTNKSHIAFKEITESLMPINRSSQLRKFVFKNTKASNDHEDDALMFPAEIRDTMKMVIRPFLSILTIFNHVSVDSELEFMTCSKSSYKGGKPISSIDALCITLKKKALCVITQAHRRDIADFVVADDRSFENIRSQLCNSIVPQLGCIHNSASVCRPRKINELSAYRQLHKECVPVITSPIPADGDVKFILIDRIYVSREINGYHQIKIYPCQLNSSSGDVFVIDFSNGL